MLFQSPWLQGLQTRGYIHQITHPEALDEAAKAGGLIGYIGFDATADSLHIGSLVQIMLLRRLQQAGGKPIVVMGGGTTKVGDPSGKDASRKLLTEAEIAANIASIKRVFAQFLHFGNGPNDALMIDNDAWLSKLGYVDFLRTYGPHFTINRMLSFDSVRLRLEREQPLTFLEFNYMLMQAVDFLELYQRTGCVLQMGGSDQWGNIVNGVELVRRIEGKAAYGLTTPLLTTSSGAKMGKTERGAVWLNADRLSPYEYWQFWRNTEDGDVGRFLRLFTEMPDAEIAQLEALEGAAINEAKIALANAATIMLHGPDAAKAAQESAAAAFTGGIGEAMPNFILPSSEGTALRLTTALTRCGLTASNAEAKRQVKAGAVLVNGVAVTDENALLAQESLAGEGVKLTLGKKRHALLRVQD
jgi:tyrosyl-tRNA synthetase